jgi:hypothetical protein
MTRPTVRARDTVWSLLPAAAVVWNATHVHGPYATALARRHRLATAAVLAAYLYHFQPPRTRRTHHGT